MIYTSVRYVISMCGVMFGTVNISNLFVFVTVLLKIFEWVVVKFLRSARTGFVTLLYVAIGLSIFIIIERSSFIYSYI